MFKSQIFTAKKYWLAIAGLNIFVYGATVANLLLTPKVWTANAELILPNPTSELKADLGELGQLNAGDVTFSQQLNPLKIVASILGSDTVMEEVLNVDPEQDDFQRIQAYKGLFDIAPQGETTVIGVSANASDPELAEKRLEVLIQKFQERLNDLREDEAEKRSEYALAELASATEDLEKARQALARYQNNASIVDGSLQVAGIVDTLGDLTNAQAQAVAQTQASQALSEALSGRLGLSPVQALDLLKLNENQSYRFLQEELSKAEAALIEKQALFTDEHPEVQYLRQQRDKLLGEVNQYIGQVSSIGSLQEVEISLGENAAELVQQMVSASTQAEAFSQQAQQLQLTIDQLNENLLSLPSKQANLSALQQEYEVAEATYKGLTAQLQEAKLSTFGAYPVIQVLDSPTADLKPSSPNKKLMAVGAFLASLAGTLALVLFLDYRAPLLSDREILTTDLRVLGQVPKLSPSMIKSGFEMATLLPFQRLASTISVMPVTQRRLLVTSSEAGEGKTTIATGLAAALTTLGFNILFVEADPKKHDVHHALSKAQGAQAHRNGHSASSDSLLQVTAVSPNIDLLSFSPQMDIFKFITHGKLEQTISQLQLKREYDYVIIDGPAVNTNSTTALMAKIASNVLMVTRPGLSKSFPFRESLEQLAWYEACVVGLVVNAGEIPVERQPVSYLNTGASV